MGKHRKWDLPQGFFAYFWARDANRPLSIRDVQAKLLKDTGLSLGKTAVDDMINQVGNMLTSDPAVRDSYEKWKNSQSAQTFFFRRDPATKEIESPYPEVLDYVRQIRGRKGYYPPGLMVALNQGAKFWAFCGRKRPDDWSKQDYDNYLTRLSSKPQKYVFTVAVRAFGKQLRDITNLTKGFKNPARMPAMMQLPNFDQTFAAFKNKVIELTPYEWRNEMEFILRVKPAVGIRTGEPETGKGLWGTKVGGKVHNERGQLLSYIHVANDSVIWHVLEKGDEEWDIKWWFGGLDAYVSNYVKRLEFGQFLINKMTSADVNRIFGQACDALKIEKLILHDMRKVYVTALVRSGIPLEKAVSMNVGWKTIDVAHKHYLAVLDLGEREQEYRRNLEKWFHVETVPQEAIIA